MVRLLNRLGLRTWRRRVLAGLGLFVVFSIGSVEATSQSWFCNSCHIMNPYYSSWKSGAHKGVDCVKCHITPGMDSFLAAKLNGLGQVVDDVLYRTSTKSSASVSQLACTRSGCHDINKVAQTEKKDGPFKYKHQKHLGLLYQGIPLQCSTCHSHVKGDKHFEVNTGICVTCHLLEPERDPIPATAAGPRQVIRLVVRESASMSTATGETKPTTPVPEAPANHEKVAPATCTTCHNPPQGILERGGLKVDHAKYLSYGALCESCHRNVTATPEPIDDGRCLECHNFGIERALPTVEMHSVHSQGRHKIECFSCHGTVLHGPSAQLASQQVFDCRRCHSDQHNIQRATYLSAGPVANHAPVAGQVSPMFLAHVDCTGCHIKKRPLESNPSSGARVAVAVPEACDRCHKQGLGAQMIPLWQKTTRTLYDQVAADIDAGQAAGAQKELLDECRSLLEMIRVDGSWGVHNPRYTQQVLEEARQKLRAALGTNTKEATP